eukprot:3405894-Pleurochrysis_carterae.AAC.1
MRSRLRYAISESCISSEVGAGEELPAARLVQAAAAEAVLEALAGMLKLAAPARIGSVSSCDDVKLCEISRRCGASGSSRSNLVRRSMPLLSTKSCMFKACAARTQEQGWPAPGTEQHSVHRSPDECAARERLAD